MFSRCVILSLVVMFLIPSESLQAQGALTLEKIEALVSIGTPDAAVASEISRRGVAFRVDRPLLDRLQAKGAGSQTLEALGRRMPVLDGAKQDLPKLITRLVSALDQGDLQSLAGLVDERLLRDVASLNAICRPFTYRAHSISGIIERPNREVEVRLRVLQMPMEESAAVLTFSQVGSGFRLRQVSTDLREWFAPLRAEAITIVHQFTAAAAAGRRDVAVELVSQGVALEDLFGSECQGQLAALRSGSQPRVEVKAYKGLKLAAGYGGFGTWGSDSIILDDVSGDLKIVRFTAPCRVTRRSSAIGARQRVVANVLEVEDEQIADYTLSRFGLKATTSTPPASGAGAAQPSPQSNDGSPRVSGQSPADGIRLLNQGLVDDAQAVWDSILSAGESLSLPACRERFGLCERGTLTLSAERLEFGTDGGKVVFSTAPQVVTSATVQSAIYAGGRGNYKVELRYGGKKYTVNYDPADGTCQKAVGVGSTGLSCGPSGMEKQRVVAEFVARAVLALGQSR